MNFNASHWREFEVQKRDQFPNEPHYQALVFGQRSEYSPPYDRNDTGSSYSVDEVTVYAFKKKSDLELFVDEAARTSTSFVFYHVGALGKATVKVEVEAKLDDGTNPMHAFGHGRGD